VGLKTHCKNDHEYVEGSWELVHRKAGVQTNGTPRKTRSYRDCLICRKKTQERSNGRRASRAKGAPKPGSHRGHIRNNNFPNPHPIDNSEIPHAGWGYFKGGESKLVVLKGERE